MPQPSGPRPARRRGRVRAADRPLPARAALHCYRILGSLQDAEDLLQETLLSAWRGLEQFEGRSSLRAWLYTIATNRCLNALRDVLGFHAAEVAEMLGAGEASVNSALQRARANLDGRIPGRPDRLAVPDAGAQRELSVASPRRLRTTTSTASWRC